MKIGIVTDFYYPWIGGPSTVIRTIGHGLAARGHSVFLLAPDSESTSRQERDGPIEVTRARTLPLPVGYNLRVSSLPLADVDAWVARVRPEVVHVHHPFPLSAAAVILARGRDIPVVATNHTVPRCSLWGLRGHPLVYRVAHAGLATWIVWLLRRCEAVATPTDTAAAELGALGFDRPVRTISNGVDTDRFTPRPGVVGLRRRFGLDSRPVILYTGRLDAEKDMDVWLRAAALAAHSVDVQFLIGGNGSERSRLEALASDMGIGSRVHFAGYLSDDEFPLIYSLATAYCITSPVELQSISTLEAVASGLPVLGVRAGALPELIHDGVNGFLTAPGDWRALSAAMATLAGDESLRARMGEESRRVALGHTLAQSVAAYEEFLTEAATGGKGRERSVSTSP